MAQDQNIEKAATLYCDSYIDKNTKNSVRISFKNGAKSDSAKDYWFEQFRLMFKEQMDMHFTPEFMNSQYNKWLESKK